MRVHRARRAPTIVTILVDMPVLTMLHFSYIAMNRDPKETDMAKVKAVKGKAAAGKARKVATPVSKRDGHAAALKAWDTRRAAAASKAAAVTA